MNEFDHKDQTIAALRTKLQQAEEVIQGRNGRIVYLERQCAKADQDVKDASEDRGFAIKELAKVSAALAAKEAELERYKEIVGKMRERVLNRPPGVIIPMWVHDALEEAEAVRRLDGGER